MNAASNEVPFICGEVISPINIQWFYVAAAPYALSETRIRLHYGNFDLRNKQFWRTCLDIGYSRQWKKIKVLYHFPEYNYLAMHSNWTVGMCTLQYCAIRNLQPSEERV